MKQKILLILFILTVVVSSFGQIAQRGTATTATSASGGTITINKPTGVQAGDIMIATITRAATSGNSSLNGWTLVSSQRHPSVTRFTTVLYRVADGTEGSSFSFSKGSNVAAVGSIIAFSGIDASNPFAVSPGSFNTGTSTTASANEINNVPAGSAIVFLASSNGNSADYYSNWSGSDPSFTEIVDERYSTTLSIGNAWGLKTSTGNTSNRTITLASSSSQAWVAMMIALRDPIQQYTVPDGMGNLKIQTWGGGGKGGSRTSNGGGGGGGAGAYSERTISVVPNTTYYYYIGKGSTTTSAGEDSWFSLNHDGTNPITLAKGGQSVADNTTTGGVGGSAASGVGGKKNSGEDGANSVSNNGGKGGDSPNGGIGGAGASYQGNGTAGAVPGAGGGGAKRTLSGTRNGGNGGDGGVIITATPPLWGSGSRDLYPQGVQGGRAFLRASNLQDAVFPFPTLGTHYVYAEVGEQIALATSAQAFGTTDATRNANRANIKLYDPSGNQITLTVGNNTDVFGKIPDRTGEIAGPQLPGQTGGNRYTPIYYTATVSGVYRVDFLGTKRTDNENNRNSYVAADGNWTQPASTNYLSAWDISVARQTNSVWNWVTGRTYSRVLNMDNPSYGGISGSDNANFRPNSGFYGNFKILTRDGFIFNVNNNGMQGISFTFMSNNKGFYDTDPLVPSYKSRTASTAADITDHYYDPRLQCAPEIFTQRMYYALPDPNMPEYALGATDNDTCWLKPKRAKLNLGQDDVVFEGADGQGEWSAGSKGGYFVFESTEGVEYNIVISPTGYATRTIHGYIQRNQIDENGVVKIYWDGKDGNGVALPVGTNPGSVNIQLQGAEVHFPYVDVELNHAGIIIELLNEDLDGVESDLVFWDDSNLADVSGYGSNPSPKNNSHLPPTNSTGISSNTNGHIWGTGSTATAGPFGDNRGIDTWTFIKGDSFSHSFQVTIKEADLKISQLTADKSNLFVGDEVTYTVKVKNDGGPSDADGSVFHFVVPQGFVPSDVNPITFNGNGCGTQVSGKELTYNGVTNTFVSTLNLPKDCEITYTIKVKVTDGANGGADKAKAGILRPDDIYDPDGTNISDPENPLGDWINDPIDMVNYFYPPFDPFIEAEYNGLQNSNNVADSPLNVIKVVAYDDINQTPFRTPVSGNILTNDRNVDVVTSVSFNGVPISFNVETALIKDGIPYGKITIKTDGTYTFTPDASFSGNVPPISYTAKNNTGNVDDSANLYIVVASPFNNAGLNNPPVANHDTETVQQGHTTSVKPLANDSDPDGDNISISVVNAFIDNSGTPKPISTNNGSPTTVYADAGGTIVAGTAYWDVVAKKVVFTAHSAFKGEVPFTYEITDNHSPTPETAHSTINIIVTESRRVDIVANDDARTFVQGTPSVVGDVSINDTWSGTDPKITIASVTIGNTTTPLTLGSETSITGVGTIKFNDDGTYEFKPLPSFIGTVPVVYTVTNDEGIADKATLYLTSIPPFAEDRYWVGSIDNDWTKDGNWTTNVPDPGDNVIFSTTENGGGVPTVRDLYVPSSPVVINNLVNETNKALVISPATSITIRGVVTGSSTPNDVDKIQIQASSNGTTPNGTFIVLYGCDYDNVVYGTVQLYAQGEEMSGANDFTWNDAITGSPTSGDPLKSTHSWQHFGIPVENVVALDAFEKSWIQKYDEKQNGKFDGASKSATFYDKWNFVGAYEELNMFEGYEITQKVPKIYSIKGKLHFCDKELTLTRKAAEVVGATGTNVHYGLGQNVFGNSYTAAINLDNGIIFDDDEVEKTIYIYRTGSFQKWGSAGSIFDENNNDPDGNIQTNAGSYIAIPAIVGTSVWGNQIPSMQGFLLKFKDSETIYNAADKKVTLKYVEGGVEANLKPQLSQKAPLSYLTVTMRSKTTVDRTWLFSEEGTSDKFDNGWDGRKYFGTPTAFIYSESVDGPMQINTSHNLDGKIITIYPNRDTQYRLTLDKTNLEDYENLHLVDLAKRVVIPLKDESTTYNFTENAAGSRVNRFVLVNSANIDLNSDQFKALNGYLKNNNQLVITNFTTKSGNAYLTDLSGKLLVNQIIHPSVTEIPINLMKGIYILNLEADGKQEGVKLIVK